MTKNEKRVPVDATREELDERRDVAPQPHATARLLEVLAPHAAELRIVANQICQLAALLHEVAPRKARHLLFEIATPRSAR